MSNSERLMGLIEDERNLTYGPRPGVLEPLCSALGDVCRAEIAAQQASTTEAVLKQVMEALKEASGV